MKKNVKKVGVAVCLAMFSFMAMGSTSSSTGDSSSTKEITIEDEAKEKDTKADETTQDVDVDSQDVQEEVAEVKDAGTTIEEQVLIDKDGFKVTAKSFETDGLFGDSIKLLIENDTDTDIGLSCSALIVNDYMINDLFSSTVAVGKKANEELNLFSSELKAAGIENVGKIEIYFHTFNPDTYMNIDDFDCVTIETSKAGEIDETPNDAGQELYNENGVKVVGKYVDENSFWGAAVLLYIENTSGKNVIVQCDDMSINGFMVTPYFSSTVYDGKKAIDEITLLSSELEENDITSVDEIEVKFKIIDENYSTIAESNPITFSAK